MFDPNGELIVIVPVVEEQDGWVIVIAGLAGDPVNTITFSVKVSAQAPMGNFMARMAITAFAESVAVVRVKLLPVPMADDPLLVKVV